MRRYLAVLCVCAATLLGGSPSCAALLPDSKLEAAESAVSTAATALRVVNVLATDYMDKAPLTPEQLDLAASAVRSLRDARRELELAQHDLAAERASEAKDHLTAALDNLNSAVDVFDKLGADVTHARTALAALRYQLRLLP